MTWLGASELDLLVVGSGVAGLSAAVRAADEHEMRVGVLTKSDLDQATTRWAQGGVAAVLSGDPDSTDLHLADTLSAGAGLCDLDAVRVLVDEGPSRVIELIAMGARFDRDTDGNLLLAREGGHTLPRIVHAGGAATGAEIERALVERVRDTVKAVWEQWFGIELVVRDGRCRGVRAVDHNGEVQEIKARNVLLATGGSGQAFAITTNPIEATGDGLAMALRAGVPCADVEFVQFHPTALVSPRMPRPLLSEALRGHGALLRDTTGERFVDELLPRDQVSKAITRRMLELGVDHVWLDATPLASFSDRFPTIAADLAAAGLDPATDWLPVAPAAHYHCGGLVTDLKGATALPGLWAAGEVTCTGVHGANRLASNSLLEGMVFGPRAVEAIARGADGPEPTGAMRTVLWDGPAVGVIGGRRITLPNHAGGPAETAHASVEDMRDRIQRTMTTEAGVLRSAASLERADGLVRASAPALERSGPAPAVVEARNLALVSHAVLTAALARQESRGCHTRTDFPELAASRPARIVL
jgi:L-aspartate oxidase